MVEMGMVIHPIIEILINGMTIYNGYGHPSMGIYIYISINSDLYDLYIQYTMGMDI